MEGEGRPIVANHARLQQLLVTTSRTFALSIPMLSEPTRKEVTVAYLLFRIADTLEDATAWEPERQVAELQRFAALLDRPDPAAARAIAADWLDDPPVEHAGYMELLDATPLVFETLLELADESRRLICLHDRRTVERMATFVARCDDAGCLRLADLDDLRDYCYAVAGIVGEMLTELFLLASPALAAHSDFLRRRAAAFGEALQLVNILKDAGTDAREGRLYLPADVDRSRVFALARADLAQAKRYVLKVQRAGAGRGLVAFNALPVLLADRTLDRVEDAGPGAKLTRLEVADIVTGLDRDLNDGAPVIRES